jgi:hypothetical protein
MAGTVIADNLQAASTSTLVIKNGVASTPPTIQDSAGTEIGTFCRAWVNFNGTGTVAIRASFNVSSITDNGTGDYTVNFTTAMVDANGSLTVTGSGNVSGAPAVYSSTGYVIDSSSARIGTGFVTSSQVRSDFASVTVSIFR